MVCCDHEVRPAHQITDPIKFDETSLTANQQKRLAVFRRRPAAQTNGGLLVYLHATGTFTDFDKVGPYFEEEMRVTAQLKSEGIIKSLYRRVSDGPGVFAVMEANDLEHANKQVGRLPFVANGLLEWHFVEIEQMI